MVEAEAALDAATLAFLRHALPTLPLLVIGLALKEASELVRDAGNLFRLLHSACLCMALHVCWDACSGSSHACAWA